MCPATRLPVFENSETIHVQMQVHIRSEQSRSDLLRGRYLNLRTIEEHEPRANSELPECIEVELHPTKVR